MVLDAERFVHLEWIGLVQPVGLVVSPVALRKAQAFPTRHVLAEQAALQELLGDGDAVDDLPALFERVLGWAPADLSPGDDPAFEVALPEYGETLRPTWVVRDQGQPLLLAMRVPPGTDLDAVLPGERWHASPQARLERLLRDVTVPIGLLTDGRAVRLVYAPRGETSGHATFALRPMAEVAGRPMLGAFLMLLGVERLFSLADHQRLPALLEDSRRHQSEVSTALADQVLEALHELLRGFQAADEAANGGVLGSVVREDPQHVYGGLLTVLLRLVFVLYAEDRGLMPKTETWSRHYAIGALFEQLREDEGRYPDTMDLRYGAWARLLTLFRAIHDGGRHGDTRLQARQGRLFDPDAYPFLEGRPYGTRRVLGEPIAPPRVSDGVVWRVLNKLLVLSGERLSYRALDVEQIGSVYEAMMGFALESATGRCVAVRPKHVVVDLDALLAAKGADRAKVLREVGCDLTGKALTALKAATSVEALVEALGRRVSPTTPSIVPRGSMVLQPTEERRRSGSHYTPRSLTEPIVRTALRPVLADLGERPTPDAVLGLKVCDPAMGSGAFLVEVCRQLGEALVASWAAHGATPAVPPDEDPLLHARRLVAQRCLYGVDKNPFAADLAKLSLWLVTLAQDHPFTFLDHALKHGDSLVGLGKAQIAAFHWDAEKAAKVRDGGPILAWIAESVGAAAGRRADLQGLPDEAPTWQKRDVLRDADEAVEAARARGDLIVSCFFGGASAKEREELRKGRYAWGDPVAIDHERRTLRAGDRPVVPFHWEVEFPEVFGRTDPGFDVFVGNPPFAGKNTIAASTPAGYGDWLKSVHAESHGNADLVAHFFRRAFDLLRARGTLGLIATNTIAQGDTRSTGLRWIRHHGGIIFATTRRTKWPGRAAVVVSVVHVRKGADAGPAVLDGREVPVITAFLFHAGGDDDPARLPENAGKSFIGSYVLGMGFTFDDDNPDATPVAEMHRLIEKDPRNAVRIFPYIGGEEVNDSPTHAHRRWVINFGDMTEAEARGWPDLMAIVEEKVKPDRMKLGDNADARRRKANWWLWGRYTPALFEAVAGLERVLVAPRTSKHVSFTWLPADMVFSENCVVFPFRTDAAFALLQSRTHDCWVRFTSSTLEDRIGYRPSDCFDTFPSPFGWESVVALAEIGRTYYTFRADLMVRSGVGLTGTYNRFNDPDEHDADIERLRKLHEQLDRTVLAAYGWTDLDPRPQFLLDHASDSDEESARRSRPLRLRWSDDLRDEVLARLLILGGGHSG